MSKVLKSGDKFEVFSEVSVPMYWAMRGRVGTLYAAREMPRQECVWLVHSELELYGIHKRQMA